MNTNINTIEKQNELFNIIGAFEVDAISLNIISQTQLKNGATYYIVELFYSGQMTLEVPVVHYEGSKFVFLPANLNTTYRDIEKIDWRVNTTNLAAMIVDGQPYLNYDKDNEYRRDVKICRTKKDAEAFIKENYGDLVFLHDAELSENSRADEDDLLGEQWQGTVAAYDVYSGNTELGIIGWWEEDCSYTVKSANYVFKTDSIILARRKYDELVKEAEYEELTVIVQLLDDSEKEPIDEETFDGGEEAVPFYYRKMIGEAVRDAREGECLTQKQLAEKAGLSVNNVKNIEEGRYNVRIDSIAAIADALGLRLSLTRF